MADPQMKLPPGAKLVEDSKPESASDMKLPAGAKLVGESLERPPRKLPSFTERLTESAGIPTSLEQAGGMLKVLDPLDWSASKRYFQNMSQQWDAYQKERKEAGQNIRAGQDKEANRGKVGYAAVNFVLRGLAPFLGGNIAMNMGEDVAAGNKAGAAGDATGAAIQAILMKAGSKKAASEMVEKIPLPAGASEYAVQTRKFLRRARDTFAEKPNKTMVNKLSYASKIGGKEADVVDIVANDLKSTAEKHGRPYSMDGYIDIINKTKEGFDNEIGSAMVKVKGNPIAANPIADNIRSLITPEMKRFPNRYAKEMREINMEATRFEQPMTIEVLDDARKNANTRLETYYSQANPRTPLQIKIDREIGNGAREIINPYLDKAAGKPTGYFAALKRREAALIDLREKVTVEADKLKAQSKQAAGAPWHERSNISTYGTSSGKPGIALHRLTGLFRAKDPYWSASKAVEQGFKKPGMGLPRRMANKTAPARQLVIAQHPDEETE